MIKRTILFAALAAGFCFADAAEAQPLMARSECIGGFWHVMTYDIGNPDNWILVDDQPTNQSCGPQAAFNLFLGFGGEHRFFLPGHRFFPVGEHGHIRFEGREERHSGMEHVTSFADPHSEGRSMEMSHEHHR